MESKDFQKEKRKRSEQKILKRKMRAKRAKNIKPRPPVRPPRVVSHSLYSSWSSQLKLPSSFSSGCLGKAMRRRSFIEGIFRKRFLWDYLLGAVYSRFWLASLACFIVARFYLSFARLFMVVSSFLSIFWARFARYSMEKRISKEKF